MNALIECNSLIQWSDFNLRFPIALEEVLLVSFKTFALPSDRNKGRLFDREKPAFVMDFLDLPKA